MKKSNKKVCTIIIYGKEKILYEISDIVEQMILAGVKRFLIMHKKQFNRWACLLLKNKYKNIVIETYEAWGSLDYGCLITREIHSRFRTKTQDFFSNKSLEKFPEFLIENSDIVILQKNKDENIHAIEHANKNNKQIVFLNECS